MTKWAATMAVALAATSGCVSLSGRARPLDVNRLVDEPGWIVAAPTPEVRQRDSKDCGAASLVMIAGRWQVPLSLDAAVEALPPPTERGVRLGDLRDLARAQGLTAFAIAGDRDTLVKELRAGRPSIVGLLISDGGSRRMSHFEVIVAARLDDEQFVTIDPATGWRVRSWMDLDAEWTPAGRPMLVVTGATPPLPM